MIMVPDYNQLTRSSWEFKAAARDSASIATEVFEMMELSFPIPSAVMAPPLASKSPLLINVVETSHPGGKLPLGGEGEVCRSL